jgi:hypothetical protein
MVAYILLVVTVTVAVAAVYNIVVWVEMLEQCYKVVAFVGNPTNTGFWFGYYFINKNKNITLILC